MMSAPDRAPAYGCRLYLVTRLISEPALTATILDRALEAADVAAVLLRFPEPSEKNFHACIGEIKPVIRQRGAAVLVDGFPEAARDADVDGAHLIGLDELRSAIGVLKPDRIAGAGGLKTRHDAMIAGESGSDYVMFGEPDRAGRRLAFSAIVDRVAWWAELFEPPCVGYAGSFAEIAPLAAAGADFIALGEFVWVGDPADVVEAAVATIKIAGARR